MATFVRVLFNASYFTSDDIVECLLGKSVVRNMLFCRLNIFFICLRTVCAHSLMPVSKFWCD